MNLSLPPKRRKYNALIQPIRIRNIKKKIKEFCGLTFEGQRDKYLQQRLEERIKSLNLGSLGEYCQCVFYDNKEKTEWTNLINDITINETYFFREKQQFDVLTRIVLPKIMKERAPMNQLRILSAACANGAEAYTLAILLYINSSLQQQWRVEIEGCDLNQKNLAIAREGIFGEFDMRGVDPLVKTTFFDHQDSHYVLMPSIRQSVRFFQLNLLNLFQLRNLVPYQVIFCRNVLYYFDIPTREKVLQGLAECLSPNGYLFVGQTEFVGELSIPFKACREGDVVVYQKNSSLGAK